MRLLAITLDLRRSKGAATVVATTPVTSEVITWREKLSSPQKRERRYDFVWSYVVTCHGGSVSG